MRPCPCLPWLVLVLLLSCCLVAPRVQAAITLTGTVSDSFGATLPCISVTLTDGATNEKRATTTDSKGMFQFESVQPGRYSLEVAAAGFSTLHQDVNVLPSQDSIKLALVLHLLSERGPTATAARPPSTALPRASPNRGEVTAPTARAGARAADRPPVVIVQPPVVSAPRETEAATAPPDTSSAPGLGPTMTDDGNYV